MAIGEHRGWLSVSPVANRNLLAVDLATALAPALPSIFVRLRNLFDLDARPDVIAEHLALDPLLAPSVEQQPGLRVPAHSIPSSLAMRAILGQQVSVRGASTLAGRFAQRFGEPIKTPLACLNRIAPTAESLAAARSDHARQPRLAERRAESLRNLARGSLAREIDLEWESTRPRSSNDSWSFPALDRGPRSTSRCALAMARRFSAGDLGLLKASRLKSAERLGKAAEHGRPVAGLCGHASVGKPRYTLPTRTSSTPFGVRSMTTTTCYSYYRLSPGPIVRAGRRTIRDRICLCRNIRAGEGRRLVATGRAPFDSVREQLAEYFAGERHEFDVRLKLAGTPFQQRVWQELVESPLARR